MFCIKYIPGDCQGYTFKATVQQIKVQNHRIMWHSDILDDGLRVRSDVT